MFHFESENTKLQEFINERYPNFHQILQIFSSIASHFEHALFTSRQFPFLLTLNYRFEVAFTVLIGPWPAFSFIMLRPRRVIFTFVFKDDMNSMWVRRKTNSMVFNDSM